jgi:hypothetical protein
MKTEINKINYDNYLSHYKDILIFTKENLSYPVDQPIECPFCGAEFTRTRTAQKYCSIKCNKDFAILRRKLLKKGLVE